MTDEDLGKVEHGEISVPISHIDLKGHNAYWVNNRFFREDSVKVFYSFWEGGYNHYVMLQSLDDCEKCGKYLSLVFDERVDGLYISIKDECVEDASKEPIIVRISVPSGEIVFADSIYDTDFPISELPVNPSYNSFPGKVAFARACEERGIATGAIGNTCPSLWRNPETGELIIGNKFDEELDDFVAPENGFVEIGDFTTDFWAYTIMDKEKFLESGGIITQYMSTAKITPGIYEFSHYASNPDFNDDVESVFARAKVLPFPAILA